MIHGDKIKSYSNNLHLLGQKALMYKGGNSENFTRPNSSKLMTIIPAELQLSPLVEVED
jgi:hypothetical protein